MPAIAEVHIQAKDHTSQAFAAVKKNIDGVTHHLRSLKGELLALVGVAGFGAMIESAIDAGATIEKLSKKLGASTEALSQLKHVAEVSHVSFDSLTRSLQYLEKNVSAASQGLGPAKEAFQVLGLSASHLKQLKVEDQFSVLADAFTHIHNAADRTRLAMQIFGKAGAEMIPILDGGSKAIAAARLEADRLGLTLNETAAHHMAQAHEALVRLKSAFAGAANTLAIQFGPALASAAEWLSSALPQAMHGTVVAFIRFKEVVALAISSVLAALESFYSAMGHLPSALGEPFREASLAAKAFRENMFEAVSGYEKELADLNALNKARGQAITGTAQAYATLYDPALHAMATYRKQSAADLRATQAFERAAMKAFKAQQKLAEEHTQKMIGIFSGGFFGLLDTGFKGMVSSFKNSLMQMASDAAATELTGALLRSLPGLPTGHGFWGQLGSGVSRLVGSVFGGFKASGGEVLAGKGYIVGERGPEYFMPKQNGQIIPNGASALSQALPPLSIVMHIQTPDASSFRRSSGQISARLGMALQQAVRRHT